MKRIISVLITVVMAFVPLMSVVCVQAVNSEEITYVCTDKTVTEKDSDNVWQTKKYTNTYDSLGRITKTTKQTQTSSGSTGTNTATYEYDKKGNNTKKEIKIENNGTVKMTKVDTFTFDKQENLTAAKYTENSKGKTKQSSVGCTYNDNGQNLTVKYTSPSGDNRTIQREYDEKGRLVSLKTVKQDDESKTESTYTYVYNSNGKCTSENYKVKYSNGTTSSVNTKYTYIDGSLSRKVTEEVSRTREKYVSTATYKYDKNGRVSKITTACTGSSQCGKIEQYTYYTNGVVKQEIHSETDSTGETEYTQRITRNDKGDITEDYTKTYNYDGTYNTDVTVIEYNGNGQILRKIRTYTADDGYSEKNEALYGYDKKGRITGKSYDIYYSGTLASSEKYKFEYDKNGNLSKKIYSKIESDYENTVTEQYTYKAINTNTSVYQTDDFTVEYCSSYISGEAVTNPGVYYYDENYGYCYYLKGYNYTVENLNTEKCGNVRFTVSFKDDFAYYGTAELDYIVIPAQVKSLKAEKIADTYVTLTWGKVTGASYYKVQKSADGKNWSTVKTVKDNKLKATKLNTGTKYQFRVIALDLAKKTAGKASAVLKCCTLTEAVTLTVKSAKSKTASLSWKKVSRAEGYTVYKSADGKKWTKVTDTKKLSCTVTKLTGGKKMYFKVTAKNAYGKAAVPSVKSITIKK